MGAACAAEDKPMAKARAVSGTIFMRALFNGVGGIYPKLPEFDAPLRAIEVPSIGESRTAVKFITQAKVARQAGGEGLGQVPCCAAAYSGEAEDHSLADVADLIVSVYTVCPSRTVCEPHIRRSRVCPAYGLSTGSGGWPRRACKFESPCIAQASVSLVAIRPLACSRCPQSAALT